MQAVSDVAAVTQVIMPPVFSLGHIFITALVTFVISGLGGVFVSRYLARARPNLSLTALGFCGSYVHLSDEAIEASEKDAWGPPLNVFVDYNVAINREMRCSKLILELGEVKDSVDLWLKEHLAEDASSFSVSELRGCPFFTYSQIVSSILGLVRRRSMPDLPTRLDNVVKLGSKIELTEIADKWVLHLGSKTLNVKKGDSEKERAQLELIANSFAYGAYENILHILKIFSSDAADDINKLGKLRQELRNCIAQSAYLTLDVVASNQGEKPFILNPYCKAELKLGSDKVAIIFKTEKEKDALSSPQEKPTTKVDSNRGEMFDIEPFLSETSSSPFMSIPGGMTQRITLISIEPMGGMGEKLVKHFELGTLTCSITAKSAAGTSISSLPVIFGRELSQQQREILLS